MTFITILVAIVILAIAFKKELLSFLEKAGPVLAEILAAIWLWLDEKWDSIKESDTARNILIILGVIIGIVLFLLLLYVIVLFFSWIIPGSVGFWTGIAADIIIVIVVLVVATEGGF